MNIDAYSSFFVQVILFVLLALVLIVSAVSLFIKPARRTIRASLVDASTGHIIDISQAETSIGRAKACDIVIPEISVSRFHAVLSKRKTVWMIFDTNSTAGVLVNDQKIDKKSELSDGDKITLGNAEYIFYSTAVTTRRQVVPKTKKPDGSERVRYKKRSAGASVKSAGDDSTIRYEKNAKTRRNNQKTDKGG